MHQKSQRVVEGRARTGQFDTPSKRHRKVRCDGAAEAEI